MTTTDFPRHALRLAAFGLLLSACGDAPGDANLDLESPKDALSAPLLIAHRGASAYAPEHTMAAYRLAVDQGADIIEPDLQITKDGILVALHDVTLERTTNVEQVFPDRYRETQGPEGSTVRRWFVVDFTLDELKQLDAGSWFGEEFRGERIPTFAEVAILARGQVGLIPETKSPESYADAGFDMAELLVEELTMLGLEEPDAEPGTPVIIQSFSAESLERLAELENTLPRILLVGNREAAEKWLTPDGMDRLSAFAQGIGPSKGILTAAPDIAKAARARGLMITPWTFRARSPGDGFDDVVSEMRHFVCDLGVSAVFTDNPDLFPRDPCGKA